MVTARVRPLGRALSAVLVVGFAAGLLLEAGGSSGGQLPDLETLLGLRSPGARAASGLTEIKASADASLLSAPADAGVDDLTLGRDPDTGVNRSLLDEAYAAEAFTMPAFGPITAAFGDGPVPGAEGQAFAALADNFGPVIGEGAGLASGIIDEGIGGNPPVGGSAVPDVQSWQSLIAGFALIGAIARRRRVMGRHGRAA